MFLTISIIYSGRVVCEFLYLAFSVLSRVGHCTNEEMTPLKGNWPMFELYQGCGMAQMIICSLKICKDFGLIL